MPSFCMKGYTKFLFLCQFINFDFLADMYVVSQQNLLPTYLHEFISFHIKHKPFVLNCASKKKETRFNCILCHIKNVLFNLHGLIVPAFIQVLFDLISITFGCSVANTSPAFSLIMIHGQFIYGIQYELKRMTCAWQPIEPAF